LAQPQKLDLHTFPQYMKAPFLASSARKGAIMYFRRGTERVKLVVSGKDG